MTDDETIVCPKTASMDIGPARLYKRRMTLTELSERIGITLANLSVLKTGKARAVRFSTLDAICAALQCQPGDLLEFAPARLTASTEAASVRGRETETAL